MHVYLYLSISIYIYLPPELKEGVHLLHLGQPCWLHVCAPLPRFTFLLHACMQTKPTLQHHAGELLGKPRPAVNLF
jgi:hypothetical protein